MKWKHSPHNPCQLPLLVTPFGSHYLFPVPASLLAPSSTTSFPLYFLCLPSSPFQPLPLFFSFQLHVPSLSCGSLLLLPLLGSPSGTPFRFSASALSTGFYFPLIPFLALPIGSLSSSPSGSPTGSLSRSPSSSLPWLPSAPISSHFRLPFLLAFQLPF